MALLPEVLSTWAKWQISEAIAPGSTESVAHYWNWLELWEKFLGAAGQHPDHHDGPGGAYLRAALFKATQRAEAAEAKLRGHEAPQPNPEDK